MTARAQRARLESPEERKPTFGADVISRFTHTPTPAVKKERTYSFELVLPPTPRPTPRRTVPAKRARTPSPASDDAFQVKDESSSDSGSRSYDGASASSDSDAGPRPPAKRRAASPVKAHVSPSKAAASPKKKASPIKKYADPSVYAHLRGLTDQLSQHNVLWTCGINPGVKSASTGWAYAHPSNHFWKGLHASGLTTEREPPSASADGTMTRKYNVGMTNLVDRPSSQETELSTAEKRASVPALLAKVQCYRPRMITFIGKGIFDQIFFVLKADLRRADTSATPTKAALKEAAPKGERPRSGLFPLRLRHGNGDLTYLYVQFSTSGLCRDAQWPDQVVIFSDVKRLVDSIRADDVAALDARHPPSDWLELDLDAWLARHPPADVPASVRAAIALDEAKPSSAAQAAAVSRATAADIHVKAES